jgi:hypothetical protein
MQEHRRSFEQAGGVIGASAPALHPPQPFEATRLTLGVLCALLFWYVPRRLR